VLHYNALPATIKSIKWVKTSSALDFRITTDTRVRFTTRNCLSERGYFTLEMSNISANYGNKWLEVKDFRLGKVKVDSFNDTLRFTFYPSVMVTYDFLYDAKNANCLVTKIMPVVRKPGDNKIIIIDPGHGGKSKGARSAYKVNGKYVWEKDLVLNVARKLKRKIDLMPGYKAYLTRNSDTYVSLARRVEFAQKMQGDLFLSIHCNAVDGYRASQARGIEFFCWSERGSENEAIRYLEKMENDVDLYKETSNGNNDVKKILKNLIKEGIEIQKDESLRFCNILDDSFRENSYFKKYNRGVKEARFKVLANHVMPSALIEVGFMSNKYEVRNLVRDTFQNDVCNAIFNSITRYFSYQHLASAGY
jgi:N-acetylmuramoyl-L-alanine amidase